MKTSRISQENLGNDRGVATYALSGVKIEIQLAVHNRIRTRVLECHNNHDIHLIA